MPHVIRNLHVAPTPTQPTFELRFLSAKDFKFAMALEKGLDAREFTVQLLHHQAENPQIALDEFRRLPDSVLRALARAWAREYLIRPKKSLAANRPAFDAFKEAFYIYQNRTSEQLRQSVEQVSRSMQSLVSPLLTDLTISPLLQFDFLSSTRHISDQLGSLTSLLPSISKTLASAGLQASLVQSASRSLASALKMDMDVISRVALPQPALVQLVSALNVRDSWVNQSLASVTDIARLVNDYPTVFDNIGAAVAAAMRVPSALDAVQRGIINLAASQAHFIPPLTSDLVLPAQTTSILLDTVHLRGEREAGIAKRPKTAPPSAYQVRTARLAVHLSSLNPLFADKWKGAWLSLSSDNPDKLSQAAHSGREVLQQVLECLAPDACFTPEEIRERGVNGKVTRKMRVAKILGTRTGSTMVDFIEAVAKASQELFATLSGRAHDRTGLICMAEVRGLLIALDGVLVIILNVT